MAITNKTTEIRTLAIVGAGNMGSSIAVALSQLGLPIKIIDSNSTAIQRALLHIEKMFASLERRSTSNEQISCNTRRKLIEVSSTYSDLKNTDLIIEAVNENIETKRSVFHELDRICKKETIIASNTSSLSITQLASFTKHPERIIGLHFFNPAHIMPLVEVIPALTTSNDVLDISMNFIRKLGKLAIQVEECASFLVNRLLSRYLNEAIFIVQLKIADVETIDKAACDLLMPIGPLQLRDLNGLDIGLSVANFNYSEYGDRFKPPSLLKAMVDSNLLGLKTLAGFYSYQQGERKPLSINTTLTELIKTISLSEPQSQQILPFEPIQLFLPMINEAFIALQEKIVLPSNLDPALKAGLGMRKGPLEFAFEYGLQNCWEKSERLFKIYGARFRPAPLLKRFVWAGKNSL